MPCPNIKNHTDCPDDFVEWAEWAEKLNETHVQTWCWGCGMWLIWEEKTEGEDHDE